MAEFSTIGTYLLIKETESAANYVKAIPMKSYGDIGGDIETQDVTNLEDTSRRLLKTLRSNDPIEFEANYTPDAYKKLLKMRELGVVPCAICFGKDDTHYGKDGTFTFNGSFDFKVVGGGVGDIRGISCSIIRNTEITFNDTGIPISGITDISVD